MTGFRRKSRTVRHGVLRALTLVCFFNFTGLNNGFTAVSISSGKVQSADFAPVIIEHLAAIMIPLGWNRKGVLSAGIHFFMRSRRVVEYASQNAVQSVLLESALFQIWSGNFVKTLKVSPGPSVPGSHPIFSFASRDAYQMEKTSSYLSGGKGRSWLKKEKWDSLFKRSLVTCMNHPPPIFDPECGNDLSGHDPGIFRKWLVSSSSNDGNDPPVHSNAFGPAFKLIKITPNEFRGDFFFVLMRNA